MAAVLDNALCSAVTELYPGHSNQEDMAKWWSFFASGNYFHLSKNARIICVRCSFSSILMLSDHWKWSEPALGFALFRLGFCGVGSIRYRASMAESKEVHTYFSHADRMFPHIENGKVPTEQFLRACQGIADFVGFLGTAFIPVKSDIAGNVTKVRSKFEKDTTKFYYVEDLVDDDVMVCGGMGYATEGLLWLKRGLEFMLELLTLMVKEYRSSEDKKKTESLVGIIDAAYKATLRRHHGFISKQLFKVVILAAPYRRTLLKALGENQEGVDDLCIAHIEAHLDNFRANVERIVSYYIEKKLDTPNPNC